MKDISAEGFGLNNIPFGIALINGKTALVSRLLNKLIPLADLFPVLFDDLGFSKSILEENTLNSFMNLGRSKTNVIRLRIKEYFETEMRIDHSKLSNFPNLEEGQMVLPFYCRNFIDFYTSYHHAFRVGCLFRGQENALPKQWDKIPIGYYSRSSALMVSGDFVKRPNGSFILEDKWVFQPSRKIDFELEMGFVIAEKIDDNDALSTIRDKVFGAVLLNDWTARDIQFQEYQPLGPFLGKSFATAISPWVIHLDALEPFLKKKEGQKNTLPHLFKDFIEVYDIDLQLFLNRCKSVNQLVQTNGMNMQWDIDQLIKHTVSNGSYFETGDLIGTGTLSGKEENSQACLVEMTQGGKNSFTIDGVEKRYIDDGDEVIIKGVATNKDNLVVAFGRLSNKLLPHKKD